MQILFNGMFAKNKNAVPAANPLGFVIAENPSDFAVEKTKVCTAKATLMFTASFGAVGGLLSCFDISYNMALVAFCFLVFSFLLAFIRYSPWVMNVFYPLIFALFAFSVLGNRLYINSGFQAFVNILHEAYSSYFDLDIVRDAHEAFTDRYLTITIASICIGFFLIVLLNIAISNRMSLFLVILLTFPLMQLGLYIGKPPELFFYFCMIFSYVGVGILGRGGHFTLPVNERVKGRKKKIAFSFAKKNQAGISYEAYKANGTVLTQLVLFALAASIVFMALTFSLLRPDTLEQSTNNLKTYVDRMVEIFVRDGFEGLLGREINRGMAHGDLSTAGIIRPDFQTDLIVRFAPYAHETIYLRGFIGYSYFPEKTLWIPPHHYPGIFFSDYLLAGSYNQNEWEYFEEFTAFLEEKRLQYYMVANENFFGMQGRMEITNVRASPGYLYLPYFTSPNFSIPYVTINSMIHPSNSGFEVGETMLLSYVPYRAGYLPLIYKEDDILLDSYAPGSVEIDFLRYYAEIAEKFYTEVPTELEAVIRQTIDELPVASTIDSMEALLQQIEVVQDYFFDNFIYTTSPGRTPRNREFITHFLSVQRRGYCSYFASAATMIFRSLGIPARYVEGYVIKPSAMLDGKALPEERLEDWLSGDIPMGESIGVLEVKLTDAVAHAWVEVFFDNFGWFPVEVTPPSFENEDFTNFWSILGGLFAITGGPGATGFDGEAGETAAMAFRRSMDFLAAPLVVALTLGVAVPFALFLSRRLRAYCLMALNYRRGQFDRVLPYYYLKLVKTLQKKNKDLVKNPLPCEVAEVLVEFGICPEKNSIRQTFTKLEECCYGQEIMKKDEALCLIQALKRMRKLSNKLP